MRKRKKDFPTLTKVGIGAAITAAIAATAIYYIKKGRVNKIKDLYDSKLIMSHLDMEQLNKYDDANSVEDGIKFAKEVLGIKEVDSNFTLEAINFANKGIVDVAKAHNGEVFLPTALRFCDMEENRLAAVVPNINSEKFAELCINKKLFDNEYMNGRLIENFGVKGGKAGHVHVNETFLNLYKTKVVKDPNYNICNYIEKINSFASNPDDLTILEKIGLMINDRKLFEETNQFSEAPLNIIKNLSESLSQNGVQVNIDEISNLSIDEQSKKLVELLKKLWNTSHKEIEFTFLPANVYSTIHHEMGHLQDFAKNLKTLGLKQYTANAAGIEEATGALRNRWCTIYDADMKKLFDSSPNEFKVKYPGMYEFLTDNATQQTAYTVSDYAQSGIGEFIAETYAKLIGNQFVLDDVLALYKKYNGPIPKTCEGLFANIS